MIELSYDPESGELPEDETLALMTRAAEITCAAHGVPATEVSLSFVSPAEIRSLNYQYRAVDDVTDVLSFPQMDSGEINPEAPDAGSIIDELYFTTCVARSLKAARQKNAAPQSDPLLGDIVICTQRAREQATEYGHSEQRELVYLFVHGMLHLLGYDHMNEEEKRSMRREEESCMDELGIGR